MPLCELSFSAQVATESHYRLYSQESSWISNALTAFLIAGVIVSYIPQVGSYLP